MDISPARVLIIATRQIGDVLCTTPLMRRVRQLWPNAVIDVLGYESTMGMLAGNPNIDEVIESSEHPNWPEYRALLGRIFRKYDLAIVTQPSDRAHIYGLLAAPRRVGIVPAEAAHNWWKKLLCLHTVALDYWKQHVVVERLRLLDIFWRETDQEAKVSYLLSVTVTPPSAEPLPQDLIDFVGTGPIVVIHATPMWKFKRWPVQNWAELISALVMADRRVVLTGSPSQQDRELNAQIRSRVAQEFPNVPLSQVRDCAGQLTLGQTTALLKLAQLYVGVDTSITHLAAACGTQTITLFGATAPPNFGPWPKNGAVSSNSQSAWVLRGEEASDGTRIQIKGNVRIIQGPGECVPCRKAGCLDKFESHSECLEQLPSSAVVFASQND
ncbi:MAG: glycosyltransferase family 9 protein [Betaproteobacteria bacterium]|nr:glycosyltransferase family 9 protein [Betaproteobacteria bacterium]